MAMLTLNGTVQNVYTQPESKDRETGEVARFAACADSLRKHHGVRRKALGDGHAEGSHGRIQKAGGPESAHSRRRVRGGRLHHVLRASQ